MIDLQGPAAPTTLSAAVGAAAARARSRLAPELLLLAEDMAGRVDRDELTLDEEAVLAEALEAAVDAVLPQVVDALDHALTPRLEALPLHARLTLLRARGRLEYGLG